MDSSNYRELARKSLNGRWPMAILICLIGTILGAMGSDSDVELTFNEDRLIGPVGVKFKFFGITWTTSNFSENMLKLLSVAAMVFIVIEIVRFIIGGAIELGMCSYFSKSALGLEAGVQDEFHYFNIFLKAFALRFMMTLFIILWTFLFIIPGIIAAYRYCLAPYILAEHPEMDIFDAINESKSLMNGNKSRKFRLDLSFIGWAILSSLTFGIGFLFLNPYMKMSEAHFYFSLTRPGNYPEYQL